MIPHLFRHALLIAFVLGLYFNSLVWLVSRDWTKADFNYAFLIPVICIYLIWERREKLGQLYSQPSWWGSTVVIAGLILFWIGELSGEFYTLYISFWMILTGLCWSLLGWPKLRIIIFPLALLLTMFPPPAFLYNTLSFKLKLISSKLGVWALQLYGMSAYREGNIIDLGFTQLQVVDACSGLRYLIPLIVLAILVAYFSGCAVWKKVVLVVSAIPISIFVNSLRIALVGILYPVWGKDVAEGLFHDFSGWLIFIFSMGILLGEVVVLNRGFDGLKRPQTITEDGTGAAFSGIRPGITANHPGKRRPITQPPQFWAGVILLGATFILSYGVEFREKVAVSKPFHSFPRQVGQWSGRHQNLEQGIIEELNFSDYVIMDYVDPQNRSVNFYTAFYESQRKGESIHSPETCLPGGGWVFEKFGKKEIATNSGAGPMMVNRALIRSGGQRQIVYYWFPCRGRILTNAYQLKFYMFWDALIHQRTDGALVRVITPLYDDESLSKAETRLEGFVKEIIPLLRDFLPA